MEDGEWAVSAPLIQASGRIVRAGISSGWEALRACFIRPQHYPAVGCSQWAVPENRAGTPGRNLVGGLQPRWTLPRERQPGHDHQTMGGRQLAVPQNVPGTPQLGLVAGLQSRWATPGQWRCRWHSQAVGGEQWALPANLAREFQGHRGPHLHPDSQTLLSSNA